MQCFYSLSAFDGSFVKVFLLVLHFVQALLKQIHGGRYGILLLHLFLLVLINDTPQFYRLFDQLITILIHCLDVIENEEAFSFALHKGVDDVLHQ